MMDGSLKAGGTAGYFISRNVERARKEAFAGGTAAARIETIAYAALFAKGAVGRGAIGTLHINAGCNKGTVGPRCVRRL